MKTFHFTTELQKTYQQGNTHTLVHFITFIFFSIN